MSKTATVNRTVNLNRKQISALERLFHKPVPLDFTVSELAIALDFFGLAAEDTAHGGKISFANRGHDPVVVMFSSPVSSAANTKLDPQAVRKIASTLVSQGFVTDAMRGSFTLHPSYKAKSEQGVNSGTAAIADSNNDRINKRDYVLPNSYLELLEFPQRKALSLRLAQVAVNFYGIKSESQAAERLQSLLNKNPDFKNDLLFLCRLWKIEENCPPLGHNGMRNYFAIPFSVQGKAQVSRLIQSHISQIVPASEDGKLHKLADRIHTDLVETETATAQITVRCAGSGKFAPRQPRGKNGRPSVTPNPRNIPQPQPKPVPTVEYQPANTGSSTAVKYELPDPVELDLAMNPPSVMATWLGVGSSAFVTAFSATIASALTINTNKSNYPMGFTMWLMTGIAVSFFYDNVVQLMRLRGARDSR